MDRGTERLDVVSTDPSLNEKALASAALGAGPFSGRGHLSNHVSLEGLVVLGHEHGLAHPEFEALGALSDLLSFSCSFGVGLRDGGNRSR